MLIQRIITAIILGTLVVSGIFYLPANGFNLLSLLIVALAVWEFSGLFSGWNYLIRIGFLCLFLIAAIVAYFIAVIPTLVIGVLWWLLAPYILRRYTKDEDNYFINLIEQGLLGILIFVPCWIGLVVIKQRFGAEFLIYLVTIICATDIGAYFTGRVLGKRLLAPKISPKKTLEGVVGGVLSALLVAIVGILLLRETTSVANDLFDFSWIRSVSFLMLALVACLWAIIGDLFESMLKRQAGVKDSGSLLPGHGGVYDRIDSLTAAVPIFALGLLLK